MLPLVSVVAEVHPGNIKPTDKSLATYGYPDWFRDAKLGFWAHWGPHAVTHFDDWYAHDMYIQGHPTYDHHIAHYGHPSRTGWKDIIPLWRAEQWDPEGLMKLYKKAGARYFQSMGIYHDNFALWDSPTHIWNAVKIGPMKDVVGLWQKAAKNQGLKFGVSEHYGASFSFFQTSHNADTSGNLTGVPYDGADPANVLLYHDKAVGHEGRGWYTGNKKFQQEWQKRILELIDMYHPDLLYTDGMLPFHTDVGRVVIAHHYNTGNPEGVVYTAKEPSGGRWVQDFERGKQTGISELPWQTDTSIGPWFVNDQATYKTGTECVQMLVDIVSKNGNLLLDIPQRADGVVPDQVLAVVDEISNWMAINSEAIYSTRPWKICGEGPSLEHPSGTDVQPYVPTDFRFTAKNNSLYVFQMTSPGVGDIEIKALSAKAVTTKKINSVRLLGSTEKLAFVQNDEQLTITRPTQVPKVAPVLVFVLE
jgi:alpha-L-fucosidase